MWMISRVVPELTTLRLSFFGDARAAAQAATDDLEAALSGRSRPGRRRAPSSTRSLVPVLGRTTCLVQRVGLAWLSLIRVPQLRRWRRRRLRPHHAASKIATPGRSRSKRSPRSKEQIDAAYAAYAVAAVVAAVALRAVLLAMYSAFWYVAAFSVLGFVAAAVVLGPLEALAVAVAVAKVTAKVAVGAWRGLRLFLKAGGVGPVVVALVAGAYSTRALFQHRRRPVQTADKGTMTERRKNRFRDSVSPPARARSQ